MRRSLEQRTVRSFCRREPKINVHPDYQRGPVWSRPQKQLLIDSILRDLDIPKVYLREVDYEGFEEEAVDGQQRLTAIWEFYRGVFPLSREADAVNDMEVARCKFSSLHEDIKDIFESYELSVVLLRKATNDEVEEMFLRLQNGTSLNAAEKRNAMPGNMKLFIKEIAQHPFFSTCAFSNHRYGHDHVSAQMVLSELSGGITTLRNTELARMYEDNQNFDAKALKAKKIRKVLDFLQTAFPTTTPELKKFNAISLYLISSQLLETFVIKDRASRFADWFINFETCRQEDEKKPIDEREPEMVTYLERTSHSTDAHDSLSFRHHVLLQSLHHEIPDLLPLDNQRSFTEDQRMALFRRDNRICQVRIKCEGDKCEWDNWHADHRVPWSEGGKTTVENGQVACPACNLSKGNRTV